MHQNIQNHQRHLHSIRSHPSYTIPKVFQMYRPALDERFDWQSPLNWNHACVKQKKNKKKIK